MHDNVVNLTPEDIADLEALDADARENGLRMRDLATEQAARMLALELVIDGQRKQLEAQGDKRRMDLAVCSIVFALGFSACAALWIMVTA